MASIVRMVSALVIIALLVGLWAAQTGRIDGAAYEAHFVIGLLSILGLNLFAGVLDLVVAGGMRKRY